jgi:signal transduction histidine kinase
VLILAIVALGVPLAINLRARVNAEVRTQAQAQADLVAATSADLLRPIDRPRLAALARTASASVRGRILIVDARGAVLVDSAGPAQLGTSYESRPEIEAALAGRQIQVERTSKTLGRRILATAVPIIRDGRPVGAVRVTQSIAAVDGAVRRAELGLVLVGIMVLALGLFAGLIIAAHVARPLGTLEQVARRVAHGDLSARAELEGSREQQSLASSFNEMTDRIVMLLRAQRDFVAQASHQLRTPLTGLRLRLEEAKALEAEQATHGELDAALAEVDRLAHTVDELLLLSRAGERPLVGSTVDLADIAASGVERWRTTALEHGVSLEHTSEGGPAVAWAARPDAERALDALLENALRYSPPGACVTVASAPERIEVRDRGPGLAPGEHEAVFGRFHRGSAGLAGPPGSGLGLAIARELAREWGGEVTIEDREGGGSVAILWLPARGERVDRLPTLNSPVRTLEG